MKINEDRDFTINITYSAEELTQIVRWYMETNMPPIYKNYDLENENIIDMIEEEAVKDLLTVGSNKIMTDFLEEDDETIIIFTPDEAEDYINGILDEEEE